MFVLDSIQKISSSTDSLALGHSSPPPPFVSCHPVVRVEGYHKAEPIANRHETVFIGMP